MKSSVPRRGVQDIRTMTERISDVDNPQRKYLSLAMLELERARRNKEKLSATQRVQNIDQRLADIDAEQAELLAAAEAALEESALTKGRTPAVRLDAPSAGGFTLTY
jgi:uncharacterized protein YhaN